LSDIIIKTAEEASFCQCQNYNG